MDLPIEKKLENELIFKNASDINIHNRNMHGFIIRNSVITNCQFEMTDMSNADLLSSKFYSTKFLSVNFESADIFSLWFSHCVFVDVDFSGAGIEDITFIDCEFVNCTFKDVSLKNCVFTNTKFINMCPVSSTFSLNTYSNCFFEKCKFKASFQYQIFEDCQFETVLMDSSILKYNIGLGVIKGIEYTIQEEPIPNVVGLRDMLIQDCIKQNLFINAVLVSYNFDEINPDLLLESLSAINKMLCNDILLRNDELVFFKTLFHFLHVHGLVAPIMLYKMFGKVKEIFSTSIDNTAFSKCRDSLYMIANGLYFDFSEYCNKLKEDISKIPEYKAPIYITIHYETEPTVMITSILNRYRTCLFNRISTKKGSFIEYLEAGQNGLELFKIFIQILGISVPIIYSELKEKKKERKNPKQPIHIKKDVEIVGIAKRTDKDVVDLINQACEIVSNADILTKDLHGYNNSNIKEIKIEYHMEIHA